MDEGLYKYIIKVPENFAGDVMGQLTVLEATLASVVNDNGILIIEAQSKENIINEFEPWLLDLTKGIGIINQCLNER